METNYFSKEIRNSAKGIMLLVFITFALCACHPQTIETPAKTNPKWLVMGINSYRYNSKRSVANYYILQFDSDTQKAELFDDLRYYDYMVDKFDLSIQTEDTIIPFANSFGRYTITYPNSLHEFDLVVSLQKVEMARNHCTMQKLVQDVETIPLQKDSLTYDLLTSFESLSDSLYFVPPYEEIPGNMSSSVYSGSPSSQRYDMFVNSVLIAQKGRHQLRYSLVNKKELAQQKNHFNTPEKWSDALNEPNLFYMRIIDKTVYKKYIRQYNKAVGAANPFVVRTSYYDVPPDTKFIFDISNENIISKE